MTEVEATGTIANIFTRQGLVSTSAALNVTGLGEVPCPIQVAVPHISKIRKYQAEVLRGKTIERLGYYVIRRKDSNDVIHRTKFESYEQAIEAARKTLRRIDLEAGAS